MSTPAAHFPDCHPEDSEDPRPSKPADQIQDVEPCWHCGTPTERGSCRCWDGPCDDEYIPQSAIYHCKTCGRWWAYMTGLNIITIEFGAKPEQEGRAGA